jgi:hypothetical protein
MLKRRWPKTLDHYNDGDAYGGQQHAPLVELKIPD